MKPSAKVKALLTVFFGLVMGSLPGLSSDTPPAHALPAPVTPSPPGEATVSPPQPAPVATALLPLALDTPSTDADYDLYAKSKFANARWDSLVREGFETFNKGQGIQTIDFLQKAIAQGCTSALVYFKLAATYEFLGNLYTALQYYALVEKDIDTLPEGHAYREQFSEHYARALLSNNQMTEALPYLEKAALTTVEYWVLSNLANYYITQNNLSAALPHLVRSVEVPSVRTMPPAEISQVYLTIAKIYLSQQTPDEAYRYLDYAVQTDPANREAADLKRQVTQQKQQQQQMEQMQKMMEQFGTF